MGDTTSQQNENLPRGFVDLYALLRVLWESKWLVLIVSLVLAVSAAGLTLLLPNVYRADALLAPNNSEGASNLSKLESQYGGLASLAGINLGAATETDETAIALAILTSRKFLTDFIDRRDALVPLMAANGWDRKTGKVKLNRRKFDVDNGVWVRKVRPPRGRVPSSQEAYEEFLDILSVTEDEDTGLVRISIDHYSPTIASQWVSWLIEDLNSVILLDDVTEAEQAIEYLNAQVEATSQAGLKEVFFRLIEEQSKTILLARVTDEYMFKTIDPAVPPEEKERPSRIMIVMVAGFLGFLLSVAYVYVRNWRRVQ